MVEESYSVIMEEYNKIKNVCEKILNKTSLKKKRIGKIKRLSNTLIEIIHESKNILDEINRLQVKCNEKLLQLEGGHMHTYKDFRFVDGALSVKFVETEVKHVKKTELKEKCSVKTHTIDKIQGVKIPKINVPSVQNLNSIKSCIFWYKGDSYNSSGLYLSPFPKLYIRIPFMDVMDGSRDCNKTGTIKCKYEHKISCTRNKKNISERYGVQMKKCTYAHIGDLYKKIGTNYRSPGMPTFGNFKTLCSDLKIIPTRNIKTMLMYAVSDIFLCHLWAAANNIKDPLIFHDIEICQ